MGTMSKRKGLILDSSKLWILNHYDGIVYYIILSWMDSLRAGEWTGSMDTGLHIDRKVLIIV